MPLNLMNFAAIPVQRTPYVKPDYSGFENFIPNFFKAYNEPEEARLKIENSKHDAEAKRIANALSQKYGEDEKRAELALKAAQAEHYLNPLTTTQRDLSAAFSGDPEGFKKALRAEYGVYDQQETPVEEGIPNEVIGRPLNTMPKQGQNAVMKRMHDQLRISQSQSDTLPILKNLEEVVKENPDLWKSFALILDKPGDSNTSEYVKRNFAINEKDKTAIDKFGKLAGDLVATGGESFAGGKNFTDARQELISKIKPDVRNTSAANLFVIDNLRKKAIGAPVYSKALRWGLKNGREIIPNDNLFREYASTEQGHKTNLGIVSGQEIGGNEIGPPLSQGANDLVTVTNPITKKSITMTRAEAAARGAK